MEKKARKTHTLHELHAMIGKRARLWTDRDKGHFVDGDVAKMDGILVLLLAGGRSYYILNTNRDLEVLDGEKKP